MKERRKMSNIYANSLVFQSMWMNPLPEILTRARSIRLNWYESSWKEISDPEVEMRQFLLKLVQWHFVTNIIV